ncbi:MAG TPA: baseplate J/gp47 family protein [Candidatus Dormibacteraeota bacterium]|nr:baseplate J/gp47 family protein [Candidatus Dormibacteraeota bacterium]
MAANPIYVEVEEEIPEVVERLRRSRGDDTMIVLPARSRVGQSRFNFQLLKDYAGRMGKKVTVVCDDPAVQKMATETGFPVFGTVGPEGRGIPAAQPEPEPPKKWWQRKSTRLEPHVGVIAPQRLITKTATEMRPGRFLLYMSVLALVLVAIGALAVFVPSATVTLIARATPFSQRDVEINAEPGKAPIRVRISTISRQDSQGFKTTGVKTVPLAPATGQVVYTNDYHQPKCPSPDCDSPGIVMPLGMRLKNSNGLEFAQVSGNTLVPWQGTATANIQAVVPGSTGNVGDHTITTIENIGNWDPSKLTVTNPLATGNGTDPSNTPFMQESDFDAGRAQLEQELHQQIAQVLQAGAKQGEKLSETIVYGSPQFNTDHKPGDNVPSFSGTMTVTGEGDYYFDSDVNTAFTQYLEQRVPNNQQLLTDSGVKVDYRILNATSGGHLTFIGNATAYIAPKIDENAILGSIVGRPLQGAKFYLQTLPINSSQIDEQPVPLPLMPLLGRRITIHYIVEPGITSSNPDATPSPSPSP